MGPRPTICRHQISPSDTHSRLSCLLISYVRTYNVYACAYHTSEKQTHEFCFLINRAFRGSVILSLVQIAESIVKENV